MTNLAMEPYSYQLDDMKFCINNKRAGLLHEPGVGKTFGALLALTWAIEKEGVRGLVIVPPILLESWYDKLYEYFDTSIKALIYRGTPGQRKKFVLEDYDIVFISYDLLQRDYIRFKESRFQFIIADETKYIKNGEVKRSKKTGNLNKFSCVQALAARAQYLILMNGTPLTKSPEDAFHIIHLINPNIYVTKKNFLRHHAKYMPNDLGYPQIVGWKNLHLIKQFLDKYTRRLIKSDVLELPSKQLIIKQFDLDPRHQRKLKELWDYGFIEDNTESSFLEGMALMMQVRKAMMAPELIEVNTTSTYFEVLDDLLDDLKGEQVIIFAHFHSTIDLLVEHLTKRGLKFAELHGRVTDKNKNQAVKDFKAGKIEVLLANAKSAGVGLDFQQCRNVIFFELDYEVDSFWQGMDRVHRPGQTKDVNIFILVARNTPAVALLRGVKDNIDYVSEILKGKEDASVLWDNKITAKEEQEWKDLVKKR